MIFSLGYYSRPRTRTGGDRLYSELDFSAGTREEAHKEGRKILKALKREDDYVVLEGAILICKEPL